MNRKYLGRIIATLTLLKQSVELKQKRMEEISMEDIQKKWNALTAIEEIDLSWIADKETQDIIRAEIEAHNAMVASAMTGIHNDITDVKSEVTGVRSDLSQTNETITTILKVLKKQYDYYEVMELAPTSEAAKWDYTLDPATNTIILSTYKTTNTDPNVVVYGVYEVDGTKYNAKMAENVSMINSNMETLTISKFINAAECKSLKFTNNYKLKSIIINTPMALEDCSNMFKGCTVLETIDYGPNFDLSNAKNMEGMYRECKALTTPIDISAATKCTSLLYFAYCDSLLTEIKIPASMPALTTMENAFNSCISLEGSFVYDNLSSLTTMKNAFYKCNKITRVYLPNEMPALTTMENAFYSCSELTELRMPTQLPAITSMNNMCKGCAKVQNVTLPSELPVLTTLASAFEGCSSIGNVSIPNQLPELTTMASIFADCVLVTEYISDISIAKFPKLTTILYGWKNTGVEGNVILNVEGTTQVSGIFDNCTKITSVEIIAPNVRPISAGTGRNCPSLESFKVVTNGETSGSSNTDFINQLLPDVPNITIIAPNAVLRTTRTSNNTDFIAKSRIKNIDIICKDVICDYGLFTNHTGLESVKISTSQEVTSVSVLNSLFKGCTGLVSADLSGIIMPASSNLRQTFSGCTSLVEVKLPEATVSSIQYSFNGCSSIESIDLTMISMDTTNVRDNQFTNAFKGTANLNEVKLVQSKFNIPESIITSAAMFDGSNISGITYVDAA